MFLAIKPFSVFCSFPKNVMAEPRNHSNKIMHKIKKRKKDQKKKLRRRETDTKCGLISPLD